MNRPSSKRAMSDWLIQLQFEVVKTVGGVLPLLTRLLAIVVLGKGLSAGVDARLP